MRTKQMLVDGFDDIKTLFQYLYMDEGHSITVDNGITKLNLKLADNLETLQMNLAFPHLGYTHRDMRIGEWLACIEQLKEQPSDCGYGSFKNKWEEIETIILIQVAYNKGV